MTPVSHRGPLPFEPRVRGRLEWVAAWVDTPTMSAISGPTASAGTAAALFAARTTQDVAARQGEALVSLISDAPPTGEASRGAVSQAPAAGETGANLDVTA